jgi:hypothetical protein
MNAPMQKPMGQPPAPQGAPAPQGQPQGQPQGKPVDPQADASPVVDAFRTIITFVKAQEEQGNPQAPQMQAAVQQLIAAMQGQGPAQPAQPPAPAPAPQGQPPAPGQPQAGAPKAAPQPMGQAMGGRVNANTGTGRAVPIM